MRTRHHTAWGWVLGVLSVLLWASGGQANEPALRFTSPTAFPVHPGARLLPADMDTSHPHWDDEEGIKGIYFGTLSGQQAANADLTFAVEGQAGEDVT